MRAAAQARAFAARRSSTKAAGFGRVRALQLCEGLAFVGLRIGVLRDEHAIPLAYLLTLRVGTPTQFSPVFSMHAHHLHVLQHVMRHLAVRIDQHERLWKRQEGGSRRVQEASATREQPTRAAADNSIRPSGLSARAPAHPPAGENNVHGAWSIVFRRLFEHQAAAQANAPALDVIGFLHIQHAALSPRMQVKSAGRTLVDPSRHAGLSGRIPRMPLSRSWSIDDGEPPRLRYRAVHAAQRISPLARTSAFASRSGRIRKMAAPARHAVLASSTWPPASDVRVRRASSTTSGAIRSNETGRVPRHARPARGAPDRHRVHDAAKRLIHPALGAGMHARSTQRESTYRRSSMNTARNRNGPARPTLMTPSIVCGHALANAAHDAAPRSPRLTVLDRTAVAEMTVRETAAGSRTAPMRDPGTSPLGRHCAAPMLRSPLAYRQPTKAPTADIQREVKRIESTVQTQVVREILHHSHYQQQIRAVVSDALLSPGIVQSLARRIQATLEQHASVERYRRGSR
jgi:hypothetical protein